MNKPSEITKVSQAAVEKAVQDSTQRIQNTKQEAQISEENNSQMARNTTTTGPFRRNKMKGASNNTTAASAAQAADEKGGRIRISPLAVSAFEYVFAIEKKPNEALIRVLSQAFGETFPRVKVWFQNRRGRDTRDRGGSGDEAGSVGGSGVRRPANLPPAVLQTLLSQQRQQNPSVALELQQSLASSTGSSDLAGTTAQALNAMLTVNSISKFWGHHNHLLAGELVTRDGERVSLHGLAEDARIKGSAIASALLERVMEIRQGVIDQFVMTDNLIRESLPLEKMTSMTPGQPHPNQGHQLLAPNPVSYAAASPGMGEMNWETMGYSPYGFTPHHGQFQYGEVNLHPMPSQVHIHHHQPIQPMPQVSWEFVQEDFTNSAGQVIRSQRPHMLMPRMTPSPPPHPLAHLRPRTPQEHQSNQPPSNGQQQQQLGSSPFPMMEMFIDDVDPETIPIKSWILENLLKALKKAAGNSAALNVGPDELIEAQTTGHFSPADFHRLCSFLSLYDDPNINSNGSSGAPSEPQIKVRVTPTLEGHAGWYMSGPDFIRVLPEPLDEIFEELRVPECTNRHIDMAQVYILFDLKLHVITLRSIFTISGPSTSA